MTHSIKIFVLGTVVAFFAGWLFRRWRLAQQKAQQRLAILEFPEVREALEREFLAAANATGKPRGLRWKDCELHERQIFASDRSSGELVALVGTTVSFEAIAGGDMEDVEAVGDLRCATAIFTYGNHRWTTDGRVVFNLEPDQVLERYQESLEAIV